MTMPNRSCLLVIFTVFSAVIITQILRTSYYGYKKTKTTLPAERPFPLKNIPSDGGYLVQGKRGKGIGSKDINGRRLQEEGERENHMFWDTMESIQEPDVEIELTPNSNEGKTRWRHRGSRQARMMFTRATVNTNVLNFEPEQDTWFRSSVAVLGKLIGSCLNRDASLNLARQLYFK